MLPRTTYEPLQAPVNTLSPMTDGNQQSDSAVPPPHRPDLLPELADGETVRTEHGEERYITSGEQRPRTHEESNTHLITEAGLSQSSHTASSGGWTSQFIIADDQEDESPRK